MSWERDLLHRYAQATRPAPGSSVRVKRRLLSPESDPEVRALLRDLPGPRRGAELRVRRRLFAPTPSRARLWLPLGAGAAAVLGALLLLRPAPPTEPTLLPLDSTAQLAHTAADGAVSLSYQGRGAVRSSAHHHEIAWEQGQLRVEVVPHQGEEVVVTTPEARLRVVGTIFEVERDRLGTRVEVERGEVELRCGEAEPLSLVPEGPALTCLPTTAGGLLGRANALAEGGEWEQVLDACVAGLALAPEPGFAAALDELRLRAHRELAAAALPADCPAALSHLQALSEAGALRGAEEAWLAECARSSTPASPGSLPAGPARGAR